MSAVNHQTTQTPPLGKANTMEGALKAFPGRKKKKSKIKDLKNKIKAGSYQIDYDAVAEKILRSEF